MTTTGDTVFGLLLWPSARTMRWVPFAVIVAIAVAVVREGTRDGRDPAEVALPIATTLLGVWLCLTFEDAAAELTSPAPVPQWVRRCVRASIALPAAALAWFALTWVGPLDGPTVPMSSMFVAVALVALACAAIASRRMPSERSGIAAAFGVAGVTLALPFVLGLALHRPVAIDPSRVPVGDPASYWTAVAAVAIIALVLAHRDLALPGPVAWLRSRPGPLRTSRAAPVRESR